MSARRRVYEILESIDRGRRWSWETSSDRDDGFIRTIVHGVLRWRLTLDHLISRLSGRDVSRIDEPVLRLLRIGIYQLHWMRVPDHAAVNESVELAKRIAPRGKGFVNAILRKATRTNLDDLIPRSSELPAIAIRTSHPEWLLRRWSESFGAERMLRIAESNQEPSTPDLLIDETRTSFETVRARLDEAGITCEPSRLVPGMMRVFGSTSALSDLIEQGHVWPMDEGSAVVAMLAGEDNDVLDLAAAPGGKTIAMFSRGNRVVSHDVAIERLAPLVRRRRYDSRIRIVVGDGTRPPFRTATSVVLLDAPCSASGIIRKHPEIRWRLSEELIRRSASLQKQLISSALKLTRDRMVYATCSLERDENDDVVRGLISERDDVRLGDAREHLPENLHQHISRGVLRLTPDSGSDGFTAFVLERR